MEREKTEGERKREKEIENRDGKRDRERTETIERTERTERESFCFPARVRHSALTVGRYGGRRSDSSRSLHLISAVEQSATLETNSKITINLT